MAFSVSVEEAVRVSGAFPRSDCAGVVMRGVLLSDSNCDAWKVNTWATRRHDEFLSYTFRSKHIEFLQDSGIRRALQVLGIDAKRSTFKRQP